MTDVINSILTEMKMALSRGTVDMTQVRRWKIGLEAHKAAPVTEEMVERALLALSGHCIDCRPHWAENRRDRELIRDALTEALADHDGATPPAASGDDAMLATNRLYLRRVHVPEGEARDEYMADLRRITDELRRLAAVAPAGMDAVTEALRQLPRYRPTIHTVDQGRKMAAMDPRLPNGPTIPADPREWVRWSDIEAALAARTGKGDNHEG